MAEFRPKAPKDFVVKFYKMLNSKNLYVNKQLRILSVEPSEYLTNFDFLG